MQRNVSLVTVPALSLPLSAFPKAVTVILAEHVQKAVRRAAIRKNITPEEHLAYIIHQSLYDADSSFAKEADRFVEENQERA
jgi:hypothetical protein